MLHFPVFPPACDGSRAPPRFQRLPQRLHLESTPSTRRHESLQRPTSPTTAANRLNNAQQQSTLSFNFGLQLATSAASHETGNESNASRSSSTSSTTSTDDAPTLGQPSRGCTTSTSCCCLARLLLKEEKSIKFQPSNLGF